ncbi:MAG: hypothetical protein AAF889_14405 [Cyanobacteria bacterium P01_D01_bin.73]
MVLSVGRETDPYLSLPKVAIKAVPIAVPKTVFINSTFAANAGTIRKDLGSSAVMLKGIIVKELLDLSFTKLKTTAG